MFRTLTIIVFFVAQNLLFAHDLFIQTNPFYLDKPGKVSFSMWLAESFPGKEEPWRADKTVSFLISGPSGLRKLENQQKINPVAEVTDHGTYVVGWNSIPSYIKIDASHFNEYLKAEGHENVLQLRKERNQEGKESTEKYTRYLKTLFQVGSRQSDQFGKPLGFKIEIIPQMNPYSLKVGDTLPVQVLFDGKPIPELTVMATYDTYSTEHDVYAQTTRTDGTGKALIKLTHPGLWMIRANYMTELKDDPKAEWESFWSNLTFKMK